MSSCLKLLNVLKNNICINDYNNFIYEYNLIEHCYDSFYGVESLLSIFNNIYYAYTYGDLHFLKKQIYNKCMEIGNENFYYSNVEDKLSHERNEDLINFLSMFFEVDIFLVIKDENGTCVVNKFLYGNEEHNFFIITECNTYSKYKYYLLREINVIQESGEEFNNVIQESGEEFNIVIQESGEEFNNVIQESGEEFNNVIQESGEEFNNVIQESGEEFNNVIQESGEELNIDFDMLDELLFDLGIDEPFKLNTVDEISNFLDLSISNFCIDSNNNLNKQNDENSRLELNNVKLKICDNVTDDNINLKNQLNNIKNELYTFSINYSNSMANNKIRKISILYNKNFLKKQSEVSKYEETMEFLEFFNRFKKMISNIYFKIIQIDFVKLILYKITYGEITDIKKHILLLKIFKVDTFKIIKSICTGIDDVFKVRNICKSEVKIFLKNFKDVFNIFDYVSSKMYLVEDECDIYNFMNSYENYYYNIFEDEYEINYYKIFCLLINEYVLPMNMLKTKKQNLCTSLSKKCYDRDVSIYKRPNIMFFVDFNNYVECILDLIKIVMYRKKEKCDNYTNDDCLIFIRTFMKNINSLYNLKYYCLWAKEVYTKYKKIYSSLILETLEKNNFFERYKDLKNFIDCL